DSVLVRELDVLALADLVLGARVDVRVVEEDRVIDARFEHRFHDLARTGRAAGMQQHPGAGHGWLELLALRRSLAVAHCMLEAWAGRVAGLDPGNCTRGHLGGTAAGGYTGRRHGLGPPRPPRPVRPDE